MGPASVLRIEHEGGPEFFQVVMVERTASSIHLELGHPLLSWSAPSWNRFAEAVSEQFADVFGDERFVRIRFKGAPWVVAASVTKLLKLMAGVLGLLPEATFTAHMDGFISKKYLRQLQRQIERHA